MGRKVSLYLLFIRELELDRGKVAGFASLPVLPILLKDLWGGGGVVTSECHHFSFQSTIYTYIHTHNLLVTNTNLNPHLVGIRDHHFAVHLITGNHITSNLVGPQ